MVGGKSPVEIAYGRKPPPLFDVETANPSELSADTPASETRERFYAKE